MKTACTVVLFAAVLGIFALPAMATDTGPCIDPMGCPSDGDGLGSQLDPNGAVETATAPDWLKPHGYECRCVGPRMWCCWIGSDLDCAVDDGCL